MSYAGRDQKKQPWQSPARPYQLQGSWADRHRPEGYLTTGEWARKYGYPQSVVSRWAQGATVGGARKRLITKMVGTFRFIKDEPPE